MALKLPTQHEVYKGLRKTWAINPKTKVKPNDKKYNRQKAKRITDDD